jgi:1-acyl-sn-glycerol-3-phosphate acyltransferase
MLSKLRMIFTLIQMVVTVSILIIFMYIFNKKNRALRQIWGAMQMKLLGITLEIEGKVDINANMIVMNHQSLLDITILEYLHPKDLAWVAKKR